MNISKKVTIQSFDVRELEELKKLFQNDGWTWIRTSNMNTNGFNYDFKKEERDIDTEILKKELKTNATTKLSDLEVKDIISTLKFARIFLNHKKYDEPNAVGDMLDKLEELQRESERVSSNLEELIRKMA